MAQKLDDTQPMDLAGLWKRYGNTLLTVVLLVLLAVVGWWKWQQYQYGHDIETGQRFEMLVELSTPSPARPLTDQENQQVNELAKRITDDRGDSLYADLARLIQARNAVKSGQIDIAIATLQTEMAQGHDDFSKGRARIDLARLHNERQQYNEALGLLGENIPQGLMPQMLEVRGDAQKGLGHNAEAREAWQNALNQAKEQNSTVYGLKLKLDDLTAEENR